VRVPDGPHRRAIVRSALLLLLVSALSAVLELLALQVPGSPLYLGVLPGPLRVLRELALTLALLLFVAELLAPRAFGPDLPRPLARVLAGSAALTVLAQGYGALQGMYAIQIEDLRADALPVFLIKHGALIAFGGAWGLLGWRAWQARPTPPPT
jgi:hypothetical protein